MLSLHKLSSRLCLGVLFGSLLSASLILVTLILTNDVLLNYSKRTVLSSSVKEVGGISRILHVKDLSGVKDRFSGVSTGLEDDTNQLSSVTDGLKVDANQLNGVTGADTNHITGVTKYVNLPGGDDSETAKNGESSSTQGQDELFNSVEAKMSNGRNSRNVSNATQEEIDMKEDITFLDLNKSTVNISTPEWIRSKLRDSDFNFSLPWAGGYSTRSFRDSQWFLSLLSFASRSDPSEPIITLYVDTTFREALLNWLIAVLVRQPQPPKNILVLTDKASLCSFVRHHKLPVACLQLSVYALLNQESIKKIKAHKFNQLLVIRMSVIRILNHFGYDVLNLDSDAILLRNVVPILERNGDSDVVGTFGGGLPKNLHKKWGVVVCMGAVLIRSTPATGRVVENQPVLALAGHSHFLWA